MPDRSHLIALTRSFLLPQNLCHGQLSHRCRAMDELLRDPLLAPQLVKLLNDNLQETRKALEALRKVRMRMFA